MSTSTTKQNLVIRKTTRQDYDELQRIFSYARGQMREHGNPTQWGNNRPPEAAILHDIEIGTSYVVEHNDIICGTFAFIIGPDPTYQNIYDGAWINDGLYGTIHRIAAKETAHGILRCCLDFCEALVPNIRIDTHENNTIMKHLLDKYGFTRCGIIYVDDGTPRIAYQKVSASDKIINEK